jgi:transposase
VEQPFDRREEAAVQAAVTQRWSNGPVEGHVNRLKTIKWQMYRRKDMQRANHR